MQLNSETPLLLKGGIHEDERGSIIFNNNFCFNEVKRFYRIIHPNINTIRAWHGHKNEKKFFIVVKGAFQICSVKIDNWEAPSKYLTPFTFKLYENDANLLYVPIGFANGLKALETNSSILVFSSSTLEDSLNDDFRFDKSLWVDWSKC